MRTMLTVLGVANLQPGASRLEIADEKQPGLYLIVQPSGAKSWACRYRVHGQRRKLTIGPYPRFDLLKARQAAKDALNAVDRGEDPARDKRAARQRAALGEADPGSFYNLARSYIQLYARKHTRSWAETARQIGLRFDPSAPAEFVTIRGGIVERWAARPAGDITRRDVRDALDVIMAREAGKLANRTLSKLRKLFNWAIENDHVQTNPCDAIKDPTPEEARDRVLSDAELRIVWQASERHGGPFGAIVKLLILTGQRRSEVAGMHARELDLPARTWTIPGARTKNGVLTDVWLADAALDIIAALPKDGFLLTGSGRSAFSGFSRAKARLDGLAAEIAGEPLADWTLHDLRRSWASGVARMKLGAPHVIEKALNHRSGVIKGVAAVYNRFDYFDERRAAMDAWARHVLQLVTGSESKVVPMVRAR